ncbi:ATP-dependent helicase Lhr and Lhr-like helicase [Eubacterium ruminantium]|uniref:ATP-dependent helicase Lhr and Lhr-like helicase n=1 Tax=Eubacterium ruminantium TaxID=42322 RepID=A0A1T4PNL2_9FIRM|nr:MULTISPECIES: DEAD/DEAH box helicase [Eubacterium]MCR5367111.1 DEAD/DEAH box helicase [Eubacterium sp.]SCW61255.1 ATP-dependent helicase Lhr and Lhr-like helicase [Eubacterium ruminantium]SDN18114.1 ATP-dependent helicase Lhr and Lhr-like helicase [Eubacterium ruminantium]SJZ93123.1 ATP-dependent helicase Lhr and Lhr-like helicase [Eubacterium ruminantium]
MSIFERYAPFVQDYIYRNEWENLRAVQVAAGDAIFNTDENVLISASTAAGKTEAAFFPIITLFSEDMPSSVGCIYIGPLKALINDQFERLNELCDEADIPVWHWHGDVAMSHKHKLIKNPSGILQITPESLEAMLMRKSSVLSKLFGDLRFIVIDEVHSLLRGDRGGQTLCLIERLCRAAGVNPRRIGLSATIGEPETVGRFLAEGTGRGTIIPTIEAKGAKWRVSVEHFYIKSGKDGESSADKEAGTEQEAGIEDAFEPSYRYIFDNTKGRKCLIFSNSREESEVVTSTLRRYSELLNEPERFQIHHGNISAALRETAEMIMKDDDMMQSTVTTATLELGIDIGKLERAFQIDAPWTVSSFLQRMGRTGRRNLPPEMWFVIREDEVEERAMLPVNIPWKLLQAIALIQLYVEEKWVEPPRLDRLPFSLLYHQTMSTLMSCGELTPGELARRVLTLKYFHRISLDDFKVMLQYLVKNDHIEKTAEGGLIVGLQGEKIVNSFKFYGVFKESEEYSVRNEYEELGTIVAPPPVGEKIAIAGRVWTVLMVDHKRHSVYCTKVKGDVPAYFGECPGDLHTKVLQRMRRVLCERRSYPYLKKNALSRLEKAIDMFKDKDVMKEMLFNLGGAKWCFMPWVGTYSFMTLERIIRLKCAKKLGISNFDSSKPFFMVFNMRAGREEFYRILKEETQNDFDMLELIFPKELPLFEKYDEYLPPELIKKGFAEGVLDKKEIIHLFD